MLLGWLMTKNRNDDAHKIVSHVAKVNRKNLSDDIWKSFLISESV